MTKEEAAQKIRKLLKRNGRTEAEADTASILAAALADKHGIDIAGMDQAEEQRRVEITHKIMGEWMKAPPEADYAALVCKNHFEVHAFKRSGWTEKIVRVGTEWHLTVAEYIFKFLITEFRWQWNKKRGRCRNRKQFIWGCYIALAAKLRERFARPANGDRSLEISFAARRKKYIEDNFGQMENVTVSPASRKGAAISHGYRAGQDIEIRPGVEAGNQQQNGQLVFPSQGRLLTQ